jgi:hypothetical protein
MSSGEELQRLSSIDQAIRERVPHPAEQFRGIK